MIRWPLQAKHVINVFGGHAPYTLRDNATWADEKRNLTKAALDVLDEMAPGFPDRSSISRRSSAGPRGHRRLAPGHLPRELSADQLFWQRPAPIGRTIALR